MDGLPSYNESQANKPEPTVPAAPAAPNAPTDDKAVLAQREQQQQMQVQMQPTPVQMVAGPSGTQATQVYFYQDPVTGARVTTLLPPDHPEMQCMQLGHTTKTHFGLIGVLAAVFFFPWGIAACYLDRRVKCTRCSRILDDGMTC